MSNPGRESDARISDAHIIDALHESEERYRFLTESIPVQIWTALPDGHLDYVSEQTAANLGLTAQQLLRDGWQNVVHPDDLALAVERWTHALTTGTPYEVEFRLKVRGGDYAWHLARAIPQRDAAGVIVRWFGTNTNVEEQRAQRRQVEALLLEARHAGEASRLRETWLATTLSSIGDGVIATDPGGHVTFMNPVAMDLTGWTAGEAQGKPLCTIFPLVSEEHNAAVESPVTRVLREGGIVAMANHTLLLRRDGSAVPIEDSASPIRDEHGDLAGVVLVFRDASEKRRVELEQREIGRKAEEASSAKDIFLATASHELRTPLNAILGWARLLRGGHLDPSGYLRAVETIERNALSQVRLIEDILDGSRIVTGNLHLEIRSLDMTALVRAALDAVRPAADAKKIELSTTVDPAAARVTGDPERLQQVVWNLANNAIKFTPKGGRVEVRLERVGTNIELMVRDTGQGITADFLPHVFERFRQAEGSTSRRHGGLGLGLALVRHLVEAHGGTVFAESEGDGRGATFTVRLPVRAVFAELPESRPTPTQDTSMALLPDLDGLTVLVVDDEADARDLVATVLRTNGAEVTTASSATRALEILSQTSPMILISDVGMPDTDGYELIRRVRALEANGVCLPAVALTAFAREEDRRLALAAGFHTHVAKPVEPAELVRVVSALAPR